MKDLEPMGYFSVRGCEGRIIYDSTGTSVSLCWRVFLRELERVLFLLEANGRWAYVRGEEIDPCVVGGASD